MEVTRTNNLLYVVRMWLDSRTETVSVLINFTSARVKLGNGDLIRSFIRSWSTVAQDASEIRTMVAAVTQTWEDLLLPQS